MTVIRFFLRTASKRDLEAVRQLLVETWHAAYDPIYGAPKVTEITDEWHSIGALERRLGVPNSEFIVADDGNALLGMAFAVLADAVVDLRQLYVLPGAQGRGIGAMLLAEIVACFDEAQSIRLEVEPRNTGAIRFYRRHGFTSGIVRNIPAGKQGLSSLAMERVLGSPRCRGSGT